MMKNIRIRLGENIKKLRHKQKYTQQKLSEHANIDYKYLQKIEGKTPPNLKVETISKIAKALNVSPQKLLE